MKVIDQQGPWRLIQVVGLDSVVEFQASSGEWKIPDQQDLCEQCGADLKKIAEDKLVHVSWDDGELCLRFIIDSMMCHPLERPLCKDGDHHKLNAFRPQL